MYYDLFPELSSSSSKRNMDFEAWMLFLKRRARELKGTTVCLFGGQCEQGWFTIIFHLLDYLYHDLEMFHSITFLYATL